jgi:hypothetical protein
LAHTLRTCRESQDVDLSRFFEDIPTILKAAESSVKVMMNAGIILLSLLMIESKGLSAEMEILAKDLLKIDRSAKKMKELIENPSPRDLAFFSEIDIFVTKFEVYVDLANGLRVYLLLNLVDYPFLFIDTRNFWFNLIKIVKKHKSSMPTCLLNLGNLLEQTQKKFSRISSLL